MIEEELPQAERATDGETSANRQKAREIVHTVGQAAAASLAYNFVLCLLLQKFDMFLAGTLLLIGPFQLIIYFSDGRLSMPTIFFTGVIGCSFTALLYLCLLLLPALILGVSLLIPGLSVVLILWPAFRLLQALLLYISG